MGYFVSRDELLSEIEKAVDAVFSAVGKMFSNEDEEFNRKLKELEIKFSLLINTVGYKSYQLKAGSNPVLKNRRKKMEEERAVRPFEEILDEVVHYILDSEDHELILLIDELEESAKEGIEEKEQIKKKLRQIYRKGLEFIKQEGSEKKGEEEGKEKENNKRK